MKMKTKISAEIVAHSVNLQGDEIISVLATFPRIILAEVNTHRMLSKNTSSSRAIPFAKMVETIQNDPFIPIAWQRSHSGMQGSEYFISLAEINYHEKDWLDARDYAVTQATNISEVGKVTKQLANRLLEPFMWTTMLITGPKSGWDNFFNLRCPSYAVSTGAETKAHFRSKKDFFTAYPDATPPLEDLDWFYINEGQAEIHIMALAECIWDAVNESDPKVLEAGEWHIPFEDNIGRFANIILDSEVTNLELESNILLNKIKTSVAMAARTSYTLVGEEKGIDYEKMIALHDRLLAQDPPHSSPLEHCARAMNEKEYRAFIKGKVAVDWVDDKGYSWEECITKKSKGWCNNLKGFIPYRYLVDNGIKI